MIKKISKIFLLGVILYFIFLIELSNLYAFPFLPYFYFTLTLKKEINLKRLILILDNISQNRY
jgi:hypothetical protein